MVSESTDARATVKSVDGDGQQDFHSHSELIGQISTASNQPISEEQWKTLARKFFVSLLVLVPKVGPGLSRLADNILTVPFLNNCLLDFKCIFRVITFEQLASRQASRLFVRNGWLQLDQNTDSVGTIRD